MDDRTELQNYRVGAMVALMGDISEDCWCAGWMNGNEFSLYNMVFNGGCRNYGMGRVRDEDVERLRQLAEQTGQWIYYQDGHGGTAISLADFRAKFPALVTPPPPQEAPNDDA